MKFPLSFYRIFDRIVYRIADYWFTIYDHLRPPEELSEEEHSYIEEFLAPLIKEGLQDDFRKAQ